VEDTAAAVVFFLFLLFLLFSWLEDRKQLPSKEEQEKTRKRREEEREQMREHTEWLNNLDDDRTTVYFSDRHGIWYRYGIQNAEDYQHITDYIKGKIDKDEFEKKNEEVLKSERVRLNKRKLDILEKERKKGYLKEDMEWEIKEMEGNIEEIEGNIDNIRKEYEKKLHNIDKKTEDNDR